jgi:hypothetical protein
MTERLTRTLAILSRTQRQLEQLYGLEPGPDVIQFVRLDSEQEREAVLVREHSDDTLELALMLPADLDANGPALSDARMQVIEGVSHFVLLSERARTELPATRLELELQAEVDKFALLIAGTPAADASDLREIHHWLFERVAFLHAPESEDGQRYRTANDLAARLCSRVFLQGDYLHEGPPASRALLRRFYRCGQAEKIRLALAA